ncbi:hypothetical protein BaRGS_00039976, partial [Batillaria attramentaria]
MPWTGGSVRKSLGCTVQIPAGFWCRRDNGRPNVVLFFRERLGVLEKQIRIDRLIHL